MREALIQELLRFVAPLGEDFIIPDHLRDAGARRSLQWIPRTAHTFHGTDVLFLERPDK